MNLNKNVVDIMTESIRRAVDEATRKLGYVKMVRGFVEEVLPNNRYSVSIWNKPRTLTCITDITLAQGDTVLVIYSGTTEWYIIGKVVR